MRYLHHLRSRSWELIDENSQVFSFNGKKSYVMALELPSYGVERSFKFISPSTWSDIRKGGFFSPVIKEYGENFELLNEYRDFKYDADAGSVIGFQVSGISGVLPLSPRAKYIVLHTDQKELSKVSMYLWDGFRARNVSGPEELNSRGLVVKPHLPEGAFLFYIK